MPQADRQLPIADEIFLDHVGHFVRDPEAASHALARAGFASTPASVQVTPDPAGGAAQPTGTGNVTAMLARGYIEVLFKAADTALGRELDDTMERYSGIHLAAFAVADAGKAHRRLAGSGFRMRALIDMARPVDTVAGPGTATFTLARLSPGEMPEGRIQFLTHRTEAMVWQPRWLSHPNGALALANVMIAVADVDEAAARFVRFTGRSARPSALGQIIDLDRGRVDLVRADAFAQLLPEIPIPSLPFTGACTITVRSLDAIESMFAKADLRTRRMGHTLVAAFPDALGRGAWIFAQAAAAV